MSAPTERTALYRLYDAEDRLLYVGITRDPDHRWRLHGYTAGRTWWPKVVRKSVEWFPSRQEAAKAELDAIQAESPAHNVAGTASPLRLSDSPLMKKVDKRATAEFEQVAAELSEAIQRGDLAPGDRLPSFADLSEHFGTSVTTVQRALRVLKNAGLIEGRKGAGVFVSSPDSRTATVPIGRPEVAAELLIAAMSPTDLGALAALLATAVEATASGQLARSHIHPNR